MLQRWTEAEIEVASYRLCHPARGRPEVECLCRQLKRAAERWYGDLVAEVARVRREVPLL